MKSIKQNMEVTNDAPNQPYLSSPRYYCRCPHPLPRSGFSAITPWRVAVTGWLAEPRTRRLQKKHVHGACDAMETRGVEMGVRAANSTFGSSRSKPSSSHLLHSCAFTTQKCQNGRTPQAGLVSCSMWHSWEFKQQRCLFTKCRKHSKWGFDVGKIISCTLSEVLLCLLHLLNISIFQIACCAAAALTFI